MKLYPECTNQARVDGVWKIFREPTSKCSTKSESFPDSNTSAASTSSKSAKSNSQKKKRKSARPALEPTETHLKIRAVVDAGAQWETDLEEVHGLMDEEACVVVSIATKHLSLDEFPSSLKGNQSYIKLARAGWVHLKELNRLMKLYPECTNQSRVDGVWKIFRK
jgi:hypothetical protein